MNIVINKYGLFRDLTDFEIFDLCKKNGKISKFAKFEDFTVVRIESDDDKIHIKEI